MSGLVCAECGSTFYAVSDSWGDQICGDCIAAKVGFSLFPAVLRGERKPMRRADVATSIRNASEEDRRRSG